MMEMTCGWCEDPIPEERLLIGAVTCSRACRKERQARGIGTRRQHEEAEARRAQQRAEEARIAEIESIARDACFGRGADVAREILRDNGLQSTAFVEAFTHMQPSSLGPYKSMAAARRDGFVEWRSQLYGGLYVEVRGRLFVLGASEARSRTAWENSGYRVRDGEKPHATKSARRIGTWNVYREDQVEMTEERRRYDALRDAGALLSCVGTSVTTS
jgi:hypothetical protein